MAAEVRQLAPHKWQAYCEQHGDGTNGSKGRIQSWADLHNKKEHSMAQAKILIEVTAGVIPGTAEPELTKQWAVTSEEWQKATDGAEQGFLLASRNGQAAGYAGWLMMQPDRVNWVRHDWIWL